MACNISRAALQKVNQLHPCLCANRERWSEPDTALFYRALRVFGTDFTLVAHVSRCSREGERAAEGAAAGRGALLLRRLAGQMGSACKSQGASCAPVR